MPFGFPPAGLDGWPWMRGSVPGQPSDMIWTFTVGAVAVVGIIWGLVRLYHQEQQQQKQKQQALNDAASERLAALREGRRR